MSRQNQIPRSFGKEEPAAIARCIETNFIDYSFAFCRSVEGHCNDSGPVLWSYNGDNGPAFNRVVKAKIEREEVEQIASMIACYGDRNASFWWIVGPSTKPVDISRHLLDAGLTSLGGFPGMALNLDTLAPTWDIPESMTTRHLSHAEALSSWSSIEITQASPEHKEAVYRAFIRIPADHAPEWRVAYQEKKPVCRCMTMVGRERDVAGLYILYTIPEATRRGIASALTWQALDHARSRGCRLAVLLASKAGERLYRKLGFEEFCRFEYFAWDLDGA